MKIAKQKNQIIITPKPGEKPRRIRIAGVFKIGEELEIKGSWFRVKKINNFGIMLKVLKSRPKSVPF